MDLAGYGWELVMGSTEILHQLEPSVAFRTSGFCFVSISVCQGVIQWFPGFDPLHHQFIDVHRCRGGKCSIWEGGTRGTALIYAPSFLPAGGDPGNQVR
jgi:hypothetical protein